MDTVEKRHQLTHAGLVAIAAKWLRTHRSCSVVGTEFNVQATSESPDAIGWNGTRCALVECKISRADFESEKHKFFRRCGTPQMGSERWYMAPAGIIPIEKIPARYGLLEVSPQGSIIAYRHGKRLRNGGRGYHISDPFTGADRNAPGEAAILVSILRKVHDEAYCKKRNIHISKVDLSIGLQGAQ